MIGSGIERCYLPEIALERDLIDRFAQSLCSTTSDYVVSPVADRWLLASQLQKAIRRGKVDFALSAAHRLRIIDERYFWRRLQIVAVEDVGLANPEVVATVIAVAGKQTLRCRLGNERVISHLVHTLATSLKNRTACDLFCLIDFSREAADIRDGLLDLPPDQWIAKAVDTSAPLLHRALALHLLSGAIQQTPFGHRAITRFHARELSELAERRNLPPIVRYLLLRARNAEGLGAMLPLAFEVLAGSSPQNWRRDLLDPVSEEPIGSAMAAAYDRHTRSGNFAFTQFLRRDSEFQNELRLAGARSPSLALGWLIFECEGGLLDHHVDPSPAREIREHVEHLELSSAGIARTKDQKRLRHMLLARLPALNAARRSAAEGNMRQLGLPGFG